MMDYIVRAAADNEHIRAFAATTREMTEKARVAHNSSPVVTAALGRLLTAGAMMGITMKGDNDILTLQVKGNGAMQGLTVTADSKGHVKGYPVEPLVLLPPRESDHKLDVSGALGRGTLRVIKDLGLKEPYVGEVDLVTSEIAEDLTYYFAQSEQTPSSVGLGVLMNKDNTVKEAGGFIIQLMPDVSDATIDRLEENLKSISSVTELLDEGKTPEDILGLLLDGLEMTVLEKVPTEFKCDCSPEKIEKALIATGRDELQSMIDEGKEIEMVCSFCNKKYIVSVEELKRLLNTASEVQRQ
ncbi:MAG: Hsp33 family molecular chaperone HslO [Lachnospiraceae bacterium]|nr:Hsp33 family molecular chaperone HslO [Lachnospiraceae bacterium]